MTCVIKLINDDGSRVLVGGMNYEFDLNDLFVGTLDFDASGSGPTYIDEMLGFVNDSPYYIEMADMSVYKFSSSNYDVAICFDEISNYHVIGFQMYETNDNGLSTVSDTGLFSL